ncbi:UDP-glucose 4-epimerase family protein [Paraperlucidibaca wandonensis]|uniref:UDP-glucose 4-epimerase family protein n=1 Tax=Paraperlucidibaca wandonensis TaxID=1268273 RepID=A0ABW3HFL7_9GAMM
MKRLLITGYSGFVGNHLAELLQGNYHVNLLGRKPSNLGNFFNHNLDSTSTYADALENVDVVVHCAARVHVMDDKATDPLNEFRAINTHGTLNLAKQAVQAGVKRFIFLSSIKVNGEGTTNQNPYTALDTPRPEDPYGISKAEAEQQLLTLGKETGMEIVIIRPPLVYGEGVKSNFGSLMRFVGKGFPLPFRAIKCNKRSLVSVYNLADLIKVCIECPKAANQILLVSDDNDLSTAEMVSLMAKVQSRKNLALPVPVWFFKLAGKLINKNDIIDRLTGSLQLDITHTKNSLDWKPPFSVEHGFTLAAKNFKKLTNGF